MLIVTYEWWTSNRKQKHDLLLIWIILIIIIKYIYMCVRILTYTRTWSTNNFCDRSTILFGTTFQPGTLEQINGIKENTKQHLSI